MADEDLMDSSDEEEEEGQGFNLSSFLWGNVDTHGQLEEDYMDEDAKENLAGLQDAQGGLDISSITEGGASTSAPAPKAAPPKKGPPGADTVGESDISDDEDWTSQTAEAVPSTSTAAAAPAPPAPAAPVAAPEAASFAPAKVANASQPAFQDEDDYDADDTTAEAAASDANQPTAVSASTSGMQNAATVPLPVVSQPIASTAGSSLYPPAAVSSSAAQAMPSSAAGLGSSTAAAVNAVPAAAPGLSLPTPTVGAFSTTERQTGGSLTTGHYSAQGQGVAAPVPASQRSVNLQKQVEAAQAAGVQFPVVFSSDGRPMLAIHSLPQMSRGSHTAATAAVAAAEAAQAEAQTAAAKARVRAERLTAWQAQSAAAASTAAAAAASATAPAYAAATVREGEDDEEGFLHATAVGRLPDHLVRSESQESDSDVISEAQGEADQQMAESSGRNQQASKHDQHTFHKPWLKRQKGFKPVLSGLALSQDPTGTTELIPIPEADLESAHVIQWEQDITWADPDDLDDSTQVGAQLRGNAQNGAAAAADESKWDDLDAVLDMALDSPKSNRTQQQLPMPLLEPLPSRPKRGQAVVQQPSALHPQMLRLDQMQIDDQQQSAEAPGPAAAAAADHQQAAPESQKAASKGRKAKLVPFSSQLKADDWLLETEWGGNDGAGHKGPAALLLDLNDAQLNFEVLRGTAVEDFANAAATILPALPKVHPDMVRPIVHSSAGAIMARFNISKDAIYVPAGTRKGEKMGGVSRLHSIQASNMSTLPLSLPTRSEMFHRPQGLWNPLVSKKLHLKNQGMLQIDEMLVKISSLVGANPEWHSGEPLTISFKKVLPTESVRALWDKAKQDKFKGAVVKDSTGNTVEELSPILVDKRNTIKPLDPDASLQDSVQKEPVLEFAAIFSSIKLLPTAVANAVPSHASGAALAPPAAFQRRKDLSAIEGHVVLLEYFEECPLMLSHPGMGAKLTTYYRRSSPTDNDHQRLMKEHDKWKVGTVEPLQAQEDSPFIGQLDPGKHQLAVETGMYRAPGFAYSTPATDFLLIRNATGAVFLRELTGCIAVGQQVPAMRAPTPGSRDVREIEGGRLVVHVVRDLRNKQSKAEKAEAKSGKYIAPKVSVKELKQLFVHITDQTIRYRLRDKCECIPVRAEDQDGWWQLKPGARLPSEAELRRMLSPDQWCMFDSTKAGLHRLYEQGVTKYDALAAIPADKLQVAIEQLPEGKQAAAKHLDLILKTTPWALTDNYVSRERENRGSQVAFAGPGDPTGKGRGFSFVKDTRKGFGNQAAAQKEGKLTGTSADLRRLKVPALKEKLSQAGVPDHVIKDQKRWQLVDLLRMVSTIGGGDSDFARNQRMTAAETMQRKSRLCQEIWQRQVAVLANIPDQQTPEDTASDDDMGEELQACLAGQEEADSAAAKPAEEGEEGKKGLTEAQQAAEDEAALQAMREEGMLSSQPESSNAPTAVPKKKLEAEPGARRMRRTITWTRPDGEVSVKEIIYTQAKDQDKVTVLNSGFHGVEPWNFGSRTIKGRVAAKRSLDKTASQIKAEAPAEGGVEAATAALEAPAVDLTEAVASPVRRVLPKKSGGVRKGTGSKATGKKPAVVQICRDCGQPGHLTMKNKKCTKYVEPEPEPLEPWIPDIQLEAIAQESDFAGLSVPAPPVQQTTPTIKVKLTSNPSPTVSPVLNRSAAARPIAALSPHQQRSQQLPGFAQETALPVSQQGVTDQQSQQQPGQSLQQQGQGLRVKKKKRRLDEQVPEQLGQHQQHHLLGESSQQQGPQLKKQKQGQAQSSGQAQGSEGQKIKLKIGGQSLKRRESVADSSASNAPKKLKLTMKVPTQPSSLNPTAAHSTDSSPARVSGASPDRRRAAGDRPAKGSGAASGAPRAASGERPDRVSGASPEGPRAAGDRPAQPSGAPADGPRTAADRPRAPADVPRAVGEPKRPVEAPRAAADRPRAPAGSQDADRRSSSAAGPLQPAAPGPSEAGSVGQPSALPKKAPPAKKGVPKKKKESAKKGLAKILGHILADCRKAEGLPKQWWDLLSIPVSKGRVTDYNDFVRPEDEMWLKKINGKLTKVQYVNRSQFQDDVHQIWKNAVKYNVYSGSLCAFPDAAKYADMIYQACLAGLDKYAAELDEAEQNIQDEDKTA